MLLARPLASVLSERTRGERKREAIVNNKIIIKVKSAFSGALALHAARQQLVG